MHNRQLRSAAIRAVLVAVVLGVQTASALTVGTGVFVVGVNISNGQFQCPGVGITDAPPCVSGGVLLFDNAEYVPGLNLGTAVGAMNMSGAVMPAFVPGPPLVLLNYGTFATQLQSVSPGVLSLALSGSYTCDQESCNNPDYATKGSFLSTVVSSSGSLLNGIPDVGSYVYTFDGATDLTSGDPDGVLFGYLGSFSLNANLQPGAPTPIPSPTLAPGVPTPTPTNVPPPGSTPTPIQPANTQTGANVNLSTTGTFTDPNTNTSIAYSADITFASITQAGQTNAQPFSNAAGSDTIDPQFAVAMGPFRATFVDVTTTAQYSGTITICLGWSDADGDGYIDGTAVPGLRDKGIPETFMRILHRETVDGRFQFVDRTTSRDNVANKICAQTTSLSPFVAVVQTTVGGGGDPKTDCASEWNVGTGLITTKKGTPDSRIVCKDGQGSCDADTTAGQCTVSFAVCPNSSDALLPLCTPTSLTSYELVKPLPNAKNATDAANGTAILAALKALGPNTVSGKNANLLTYTSALTADDCTNPITVTVPLKNGKKANRMIKLKAKRADGKVDSDQLKLECTP